MVNPQASANHHRSTAMGSRNIQVQTLIWTQCQHVRLHTHLKRYLLIDRIIHSNSAMANFALHNAQPRSCSFPSPSSIGGMRHLLPTRRRKTATPFSIERLYRPPSVSFTCTPSSATTCIRQTYTFIGDNQRLSNVRPWWRLPAYLKCTHLLATTSVSQMYTFIGDY